MAETRVKINSIVQDQLPDFVQEEYPLIGEFLKEYYTSLENQSGTLDILQNIDQYLKIDELCKNTFDRIFVQRPQSPQSFFTITGGYSDSTLVVYKNGEKLSRDVDYFAFNGTSISLAVPAISGDILEFVVASSNSTFLTSNVGFNDDSINVSSTYGFPEKNGIIQIDSEIILYKNKTETSFLNCVRGFSAVTSYTGNSQLDQLVFSTSEIAEHTSQTSVLNLSSLFLQEFLKKVKAQLIPGFENRSFTSGLNERNFIKQAKDFYRSKGTDESYDLLFKALFGEDIQVIKPGDYLLKPSDAQYRITNNLVVESISGNPLDLENRTLYQDADEAQFYSKAYGTITKVEKILRQNKTYYVISLDYDYNKDINVQGTLYGGFRIHPSTKSVSSTSNGDFNLNVDSTIGFPSFGTLEYNVDGVDYTSSYTDKNITQFFIKRPPSVTIPKGTVFNFSQYAYGYVNDSVVKIRIKNVLSDVEYDLISSSMSEGDPIKTVSLGYKSNDILSNNWIFNIANKYNVNQITGPISSNPTLNVFYYKISTYDPHTFYIGDSLELSYFNGISELYKVVGIDNEYSLSIEGPKISNVNLRYTITRNLSRTKFTNFSGINLNSPNVQNVYISNENTQNIYVAANSLPSYLDEEVQLKSTDIVFSGSFNGDTLDLSSGNPNNLHGFYTGDSVIYIKQFGEEGYLDIEQKTYYVKKVDETKIKLANSRSNLFKEVFINVSGTAVNNVFRKVKFKDTDLSTQNYIKNITTPTDTGKNQKTPIGPVGIFVNGVEAYSYKSSDKVYYGGLESFKVLNGGEDFDVINPPSVFIEDSVGFGASAFAHVEGKLERIDVIDGGFDYIEDPIITITGGSGFGAYAKPNLTSFKHVVYFNSIQSSLLVDLTNNIIGFSSYHKFRDNEKVVYLTEGQTSVGGLSHNASYYVSVQDSYNVKLHKTLEDSVLGINTIQLTSYGTGIQAFQSYSPKRKISSISVINSGSGYKNKKIQCSSAGINTSSNTISITDHGYETGEIIVYNASENEIGGLTSGNSYYVIKQNDNEFKLSSVGVGTTNKDFYYKTNQFINLTSVGSSVHSFNYPSISVVVTGKIGVSTQTGQSFDAQLQPIFRGSITNLFVSNSGVGYGSSDIINYDRQPQVTLGIGSGAQLKPIVNNGKITEVLILNGGRNYTSIPTINVLGIGTAPILTPVINNGKITSIKVINGGIGFSTVGTSLVVVPAGRDFKVKSEIKSWTINSVEKHLSSKQISDDDGVIESSSYTINGSQYCHLYVPRKLRRSVFGIDYVNGRKTFIPDLNIVSNREASSVVHSPIIGWAYDGNPIYGPYSYNDNSGSGNIRGMVSGYALQVQDGRPNPISPDGERIYPDGFFVEDYQFNNTGDLDEHNGRFCVTPEYPDGIYAYFATINNNGTETDGVFKNYRKPTFPYLVGDSFKSDIIDFNYDKSINQNTFDFSTEKVLRNTKPYNLTSKNSSYDFIFNPLKIKEPTSVIKSVVRGSIEDVGILTGGTGYKVGDLITFDNEFSGGSDAYAQVSNLLGKSINTISYASTFAQDIEFYPYNNTGKFVGFCTVPHSLSNNDIVSISGLSTSLSVFNNFFEVGVRSDTFTLSVGVGSATNTGIVTYFNVNGSLDPTIIRENDIYKIGSEKVKILSVDRLSSRIKVLREYESTVGVSHTASTVLYEQTRKFTLNINSNKNNTYNLNKELYFNPAESLAIGSSSGVGIGTTLRFSNPGSGVTSIFVPTKTIYLPNHSLDTGIELTYNTNGGIPFFVSNDGVTNYQLTDGQTVYVAKVSDDLIGISTNKVGLGSTGSFVGIDTNITTSTLYFTSVGSGVNHSFKTNYDNVLTGEFVKNIVTVSTSSTHGLSSGDNVFMNVLPGITTTVVVRYNDKHRRLVINPLSFNASDVDIVNDTITISNHGYQTGQKIIYTATTISIGGLVDNEIYYIVRFNKDKFKLALTYYQATKDIPEVINFTTATSGTIFSINPSINIVANQVINFDLSHSSLSYSRDFNSYSAFDLKFYINSDFTNEFNKTSQSSKFDVIKTGRVGIDSSCNVKLYTENIEDDLYYNLVPVDLANNLDVKKQIIVDNENILDNNKLKLTRSSYSGNYKISGVGQTTFNYNILTYPESLNYQSSDGILEYYTDSKTATGSIQKVDLKSGGRNYHTIPGIATVFSSNGTGSILKPINYEIGKIKKVSIEDIGFEYPSDSTLRPTAKLPQILDINPLSVFKNIGVSSVGINYTLSPDLVVIDSYTNTVVSDVDLKYNLDTKSVKIIKNTEGINNVTPTIIPVNNSNGVYIKNISFSEATKNVTIELNENYSVGDIFPFNVGDKVLVENVSVGIDSTTKGYNSKNYNYALFTLISVDPQYGGSGAQIVYNISDYLNTGEYPGSFDSENSAGIVVPQKYFPVFNPVLEKGTFIPGEKVLSNSYSGIVLDWNEKLERLKISTSDSFEVGNLVKGETSNARGFVIQVEDLNAVYSVNSSSVVNNGWNKETGFLNNKFQVTSDNNYYQLFSYSIKSKVDYETWNNSIGNLNHTVGFKKFGDIRIESTDSTFIGISTEQDQGNFVGIADLVSEIDLNCISDFDLAKEKTINIDSLLLSKEILLNSVPLQDEFQSIGNRVLLIDDISDQFSNLPSPNNYANVDTFRLSDIRSKKYITYVRDKRFTGVRQIYLVSVLHDGLEGYVSQYARVETNLDLGSFDFSIFGSEGTLRFYPLNYLVNDYDISIMSYGISDAISGVGNTSIGNIAQIKSSTATISSGTATQTNIVGIASTYRSAKVLVQLSSTNGTYYEFNEFTLLNDGSDIQILEYGRTSNATRSDFVGDSIGTYTAYISGSNINLDIIPNVGLGTTYIANTLSVSIVDTSSGINTGALTFDAGELKTSYVSISSSPSPTENIISTYGLDHSGAYYFVQVEDITNNEYQCSEIVVVDDDTETTMVEFGIIETNSGLGTFGTGIGLTGTNLYFTPNPDINVRVKVYQHSMRVIDTGNTLNFYDLTNANIESGYTNYQGTLNNIKRSFDLYHKQIPVFQRVFDASDITIVDVDTDSIRLPKHYFVTGEELAYDPGNGSPIGIATTTISGIGVTDKLPSTVFAIKVNDLSIKLADSAENALKSISVPLSITSVGVGTTHFLTSKKQNTKCLITIDNYIQSPIVSTSTTSSLALDISLNTVDVTLTGITSIFGGDLLKINNEIIKVNSVGYGGTNGLLVDRGWMGTDPETHIAGSLVTKIIGNYNIVDNTINFVEAPYGNSPIGTITNRPDDRDYTGITTRSSFSGRVFLRSGLENASEDTYNKNYIFDGLSEQFTGITTEFVLKSSGSDITGISSSSVILINNILQQPQRLGTIDIYGDYRIRDSLGISTISFTGNIASTAYDVNTSTIPRGGVIISVASTEGFGYQPLISAGGTSIVSVAGTIASISVGYTGSGYRGSSSYEIITKTLTNISAGSTIIYINNAKGAIQKLGFSTSNTIGIGSIFVNVPIVSVGNTFITIGAASTSNKLIESDSSVTISINSPQVGFVDVGVKTSSTGLLNYEFIGFTTISSGKVSSNIIITNPGSGYTTSNPPTVVFDSPLSYSNIPLVYSSGSGLGTSATIDIVVGQGSSVIDFEIKNLGYGYKVAEVLTIPTGGLTGIPTDPSKPFRKFDLTIDQVFADLFSGWSIGSLQVIDNIENLFNGTRRTFPIKINGSQTSIRARTGSNIEVKASLLIFINDVLQVPDIGYTFDGGSIITFSEPPKRDDQCKILFYKGTDPVDVVFVDILETIKIGDNVTLNSDNLYEIEEERLVTDIIASDTIETNPYTGFGITLDETLLRPLTWCKQTEDKIINGREVGKDRELYEPLVYPTTNLIQPVSVGTTIVYVENLRPLFNSINENDGSLDFQDKITITSQDSKITASATAVVSSAGTISSIIVSDGGFGYNTAPKVIIQNPVGIATTTSTAISSITSGIVTSITLTGSVVGYSQTNPPSILIESPTLETETNNVISYTGDSGAIVGFGTTSGSGGVQYIMLDLHIPLDSYLRNTTLVSTAITVSSLSVGDYFSVNNSNIGIGTTFTSIRTGSSVVGIATTFIDAVYQVSQSQILQRNISGVGLTYVNRIFARIATSSTGIGTINFSSNLITFDSNYYTFDSSIGDPGTPGTISTSNYFGNYSWGKILLESRNKNIGFNYYGTNGIVGITSSAIVQRFSPLKYKNYVV
jgi:hypothetical protein